VLGVLERPDLPVAAVRDDAATQFERVAVNFRHANAAAAAAALAALKEGDEEQER
jgi:hypothetical protein